MTITRKITEGLEEMARMEAIRRQGQEEGFAAAVQQLRGLDAQKPPHPYSHEAMLLADYLEQSRIPAEAKQ